MCDDNRGKLAELQEDRLLEGQPSNLTCRGREEDEVVAIRLAGAMKASDAISSKIKP